MQTVSTASLIKRDGKLLWFALCLCQRLRVASIFGLRLLMQLFSKTKTLVNLQHADALFKRTGVLPRRIEWILQTYSYKSSAAAKMGDRLATINMATKVEGARSPSDTMSLRRGLPPYQVAYWSIQPFGHNRHGSKIGGSVLLERVPSHLTQCRLNRGLLPYQVASWSIQPFGQNRHGLKIRGSALLQGTGSPPNTMWPGPRTTSIPSAKWHVDPSSRLATTDMGLKRGGGLCCFLGGGAEAYLHTKWHIDP